MTLVLFQPAPLAAGLPPALIVGAVASRLMVTDSEAVPPSLVAEQVNGVPTAGVSELIIVGSQPVFVEIADSASTTPHVTLTSLVYQPFAPRVPVTVGVMTG